MDNLNKISTTPLMSNFEHSDSIKSLDSRLAIRKKKSEESEQAGLLGCSYFFWEVNEHIQKQLSLKHGGGTWESGRTMISDGGSESSKLITDEKFSNLVKNECSSKEEHLMRRNNKLESDFLTVSKDSHTNKIESMSNFSLGMDGQIDQNKSHFLYSELDTEREAFNKLHKKKLTRNKVSIEWSPLLDNKSNVNALNYNIQPLKENFASEENLFFRQLNTLQQMVMSMSSPVLQGLIYRFNLKKYQKEYVVVTKDHSGKYIFDSSSENVFSLLSTNTKNLKLNSWTLKYKDRYIHQQ
ncbi:hypothetical protein [Citrobacter sp. wls826]|uniref:hypothetical protein n=1 Tax=Citrobacter sp. wls826 TaxID=2576415 RepID=UPI0010CA1AF6|nr:hypothetical protein [Citrobacter sp. wls826]TKU24778.1 hypothetical protein FDW87_01845 [Citrobacter sp. wls826]TKV30103.1 hypothetical protein FDX20_27150 [Citrobacter sp. TBCS-11]